MSLQNSLNTIIDQEVDEETLWDRAYKIPWDDPYICLIENHWFDKQQTALQQFHIIEAADGTVTSYRSTTKAWTNDQYKQLLKEAGFAHVTIHSDWPIHSQDLLLLEASK